MREKRGYRELRKKEICESPKREACDHYPVDLSDKRIRIDSVKPDV